MRTPSLPPRQTVVRFAKRTGLSLLRIYVLLCLGVMIFQRKLLYFPTHEPATLAKGYGLAEWVWQGAIIGFKREAPSPARIWLFLHGNGGQALDRAYALQSFSDRDSVFILEYPGYGSRPGAPSQDAFNEAAKSAYEALRETFPNDEINVLAESLGSGPGCFLASQPNPPTRLVLVVPFDALVHVAQNKFPFLPVGLMLFDRWNNIQALNRYPGRVDIYGATHDDIIPISHARNLAAALKGSRFTEINCGHNDWTDRPWVDLGR